LAILAIAQLMVVLDATIVNIALPSAQRALHFANSERQWIVTAYALAFGSLLLLGGRISDLLGRKWTFIVGLAGFATASAVGGALALLHNQAPAVKPKLDIPGVLTVSAGLFSLVFGFSHAETTSWANHTTVAFLTGGALLLALFAVIQSRSRNPLLPLRVVTNRNRGASFLSIGIAGAAVFAVFLFLTYYLQQVRGYTPIRTGVAFLPISAAVMLAAIIATNKLRPRVGPRPLMIAGMLLGGGGMLYLTRLTLASSYATGILPALIMIGIGIGLVFSTSINSATLGVEPADAGVASATVSASQQVGGSLGTALLSTIAASALTNYITSAHTHPTRLLLAHAALHGDTTAFAWAAVIFAAGAVIAATLFEHGTKALGIKATAAPATAH